MYEIFYTEIEVKFYNATRRKVETYFKPFRKSIIFRNGVPFYEELTKHELHRLMFTPKEKSYITDLSYKQIHSQGKPLYNPIEQTKQFNFIYHGSTETKHLPRPRR